MVRHGRVGPGWAKAYLERQLPGRQGATRAPLECPGPTVLQVQSEEARQESLERLSGYLDIVETHLVREIAARTGGLPA